MDFINGYGSSGSDSEGGNGAVVSQPAPAVYSSMTINAAPSVAVTHRPQFNLPDGVKTLKTNPRIDTLWSAAGGLQQLHQQQQQQQKQDGGIGTVDVSYVDAAAFEQQFYSHEQKGYSYDPSGTGVVSNYRRIQQMERREASQQQQQQQQQQQPRKRKRGQDRMDTLQGDIDGLGGPWAPVAAVAKAEESLTEEQQKYRQGLIDTATSKAKKAKDTTTGNTTTDGGKEAAPAASGHFGAGMDIGECETVFHGKSERDYQGRSWIEEPRELHAIADSDHECYIPKRCIHKYTGHTKGVNAIEFFPKYGHLLLSASMDSKVKIWDVTGTTNNRQCMRTYKGHTGAVRDIHFSNDGRRFLSASYDKQIKLWDTETGTCISSFTNGKMPYCCRFYPRDNNIFVIGASNKRIVAFDVTSGEIVQEYDHHLNSVNSVTFLDEGRRFVSTSDDKKIMIWEWDTPVPIKYIAEPHMHTVPAVAMHPSGDHFACQSMNNEIHVYEGRNRYRMQRKKIFKGHLVAGYACQPGFSPNGRFIASGDGNGKLWFWDWKSTRKYKTLRAHDNGPCMQVKWHPIEASRVASCGWDGIIKLWD